jgi:hypothetical protein
MFLRKKKIAARKHSVVLYAGAQPRGGGCRAAAPQTPQKLNFKIDFIDIMVSEVLRDLPFSRNQPLKSADD